MPTVKNKRPVSFKWLYAVLKVSFKAFLLFDNSSHEIEKSHYQISCLIYSFERFPLQN